MKKIFLYFLSFYSIYYVRSLVYMLQKTEYSVKDFLIWYKVVKNFNQVEKIGKLIFTKKVKIIYFVLEFSRVILFIFLLYELLFNFKFSIIFLFFISPIIFLLEIVVLNFVFKILQKPFEIYLFYKAKEKLKNINAIKIAIAGSYGKTIMREILLTVLSEGKKVKTVKENFNTPHGISEFIMSLEGDEEILIFEFGEYYKGDIKFLSEFVQPDFGIITGINEAHLEKFKSIENTINTVFELSDYLKNENIFVNIDNKYAKENLRIGNTAFGLAGIENFKLTHIVSGLGGSEFTILDESKKIKNIYKTSLLGKHNIPAIMLAIYLAEKFKINFEQIKNGVEKIKSFKNRLELKSFGKDILLLDDSYNGNIDGFLVTFDLLRNISDRRIVYITPGLVETGSANEVLHTKIGLEIMNSNIKNVILIKNSATKYIAEYLVKNNYKGSLNYFESMTDVLEKLNTLTLPNDLVVIQNDWGDQYF